MPESCTCGARLPEDARFCHKCGKPQYDYPGFEPDPVAEVVAAPVPPPPPAASNEISFRNRTAVRVGFVTALIAFLVIFATMAISPVFIIAALAAGFFAVYLYTRRTGQSLSLISGARMGWITGIFLSSITIVLFTIIMVVASSQGGLLAMMEKAQQQQQSPYNAELTKLLQSPDAIPTLLVSGVIAMGLFFIVLPTLGGALGAKLLTKEQ